MGNDIVQADVPNAYLNADKDEEVYVNQPYGICDYENKNKVCLLRKVLYSSVISGKKWHKNVTEQTRTLGYECSVIDHCLFIRNKRNNIDLLVIYVNNVLLVTSTAGIEQVKKQLNELEKSYEIKRLGKATYILGIGVYQSRNGIVLEQRAYLESILDEVGYLDAIPRGTPWNAYQKGKGDNLDEAWTNLYRRIVGQLIYLMGITRPGISFAVGRMASNMKTPNEGDWERVKRMLNYLNRTKDIGIAFSRHQTRKVFKPEMYTDASFATDRKKRKSITGNIVHRQDSPVCWKGQTLASDCCRLT